MSFKLPRPLPPFGSCSSPFFEAYRLTILSLVPSLQPKRRIHHLFLHEVIVQRLSNLPSLHPKRRMPSPENQASYVRACQTLSLNNRPQKTRSFEKSCMCAQQLLQWILAFACQFKSSISTVDSMCWLSSVCKSDNVAVKHDSDLSLHTRCGCTSVAWFKRSFAHVCIMYFKFNDLQKLQRHFIHYVMLNVVYMFSFLGELQTAPPSATLWQL